MRFLLAALALTLIISLGATGHMNKDAKIFVAGHRGLVGSSLVRRLSGLGYSNIIMRSAQELDLRNQSAVQQFFAQEKPDYVFLAAAKVGGIWANMQAPAEFIYDNLAIELNVIHAAYQHKVKKLLFLGSSCIYPRDCPQPIKEEYLLSSKLESSNEAYALAKISGLKMCEAYNKQYGTKFISCMPTNLYGPGDNFDLNKSHVIPALIRKFVTAKKEQQEQVAVWGTGSPYREFLYVDDLADACIFLMNSYEGESIINIGTGKDLQIKELAGLIKRVVGYQGEIIFDSSKPDGTPKKLLNIEKLSALGWQAPTTLSKGLEQTVAWCEQEKIFG